MMKSNHGMGMSNCHGMEGDPSRLVHGITPDFIRMKVNKVASSLYQSSEKFAKNVAHRARTTAEHNIELINDTSDEDLSEFQKKAQYKREVFAEEADRLQASAYGAADKERRRKAGEDQSSPEALKRQRLERDLFAARADKMQNLPKFLEKDLREAGGDPEARHTLPVLMQSAKKKGASGPGSRRKTSNK